jgi:AcrR family transcriptional regulator
MQQRSEETRAHILEAAQKLFSRTGYAAASVQDICDEAGVSKGAFYHHFPTKQAVFLALLDVWLGGLDDAFTLVRQTAPNTAQAFSQMAEMVGAMFEAADVRLSMFLEFWTQASRDPAIGAAAAAPYHRYQNYVAAMIRNGIADGSLQAEDVELTARVIVSLGLGLLMQALFEPGGADWGRETQRGFQVLLDGLTRRAA